MKIHVTAASLAGLLLAALSVSGTQTAKSANPTEAMTVTGCLRENPMRAGAYVLDATDAGSGEKSYRLIGSGSADLKPHLGHKVRVTGTVAKSVASGTASGATSNDDGPAMNVTIVAHVADACSASSK
jgi:hypothetical protein